MSRVWLELAALMLIAAGVFALLLLDPIASIPFSFVSLHFAYIVLRLRLNILHPATLLSLVYFGCLAVSLFTPLDALAGYGLSGQYNVIPQILFGFCTVALLSPASKLKPLEAANFRGNRFLDAAVTFGWIPALFSVIYLAPYAYASTMSGAEVVRLGLSTDGSGLPPTLITTAAVGVSQFFSLYVMLWFYASARGRSAWVCASLLLGVLAGLLWGMVFAARDMLLWIPLTFWFGLWYWRSVLTARQIAQVQWLFRISVVVLGSIFVLYTFQRFWYARTGLVDSLMAYYGYQPYVFAETVASQDEHFGLSLRFPLFSDMLGVSSPVERTEPYEWMFGTLLTDFYTVAGWRSLFAMTLGVVIAMAYVTRQASRLSYISSMLIYLLYFTILTQGVFYFRYGTVAGNFLLLSTLMAAVIFSVSRRGKYAS